MIGKANNEPSKITNKSLIVIKNTINNNKYNTKTLDLNIVRRPLSPVHKLEPKKIIIKRSNIQSTSTNATTTNTSAKASDNIPNSKDKTIQIEPIAPKTKQPAQPSPITDSENFENIDEEEQPMKGDPYKQVFIRFWDPYKQVFIRFWDPYKHRRNQGEQPYYRWQGYKGAVNSDFTTKLSRACTTSQTHVDKFDKRWYPSSELNTSGPRDVVI